MTTFDRALGACYTNPHVPLFVVYVRKCNDPCLTRYLQVWITPLCIEHSLLVVDLKSDNILIVVGNILKEKYVQDLSGTCFAKAVWHVARLHIVLSLKCKDEF